jgi:methylated-DNA-[protein]-cysteine S-methyltransferase
LAVGYDLFTMVGVAYTVFDTAVGRCAIAWGQDGVLGVQLADVREIETRRRLLRQFPEARELRPSADIQLVIDGICTLLRGQFADLSDIPLDMSDLPPFDCRVYEMVRRIPRGETRTRAEIATQVGSPGIVHSLAQALARNPFALVVPCHRVLESAGRIDGIPTNGGAMTRARLLSLEGALPSRGSTLFDALLSVAPRHPPR